MGKGIRLVALGLLCFVCVGCSLSERTAPKPKPRIIVLGFDGADPTRIRDYNADPNNIRLPNLAALAHHGTFEDLATTNPPSSVVSWSSFATGMEPGNTGIFGFLTRYFDQNGVPTPNLHHFGEERDGTAFWRLLDQNRITPVLLNMPITFPAKPMPNKGRLLTGLGTPDLRGHWGAYTLFVDRPYKGGKKSTETGGSIVTVMTSGGEGTAYIKGLDPIDADLKGAKKKAMIEKTRTEVAFVISKAEKTVGLTVGGNPVPTLHEGEWSDWVEMTFPLTPIITLHGMAKFQLISTSPLQLYMSPIQFHPAKPINGQPFTTPPGFGKHLYQQIGPFPTLGWPIPSNPLKDEVIDEAGFLSGVQQVVAARRRIMDHQLAQNDWQFFAMVYTFTDRVQHMMGRLRDKKSPRYEQDKAVREEHGDAIFKAYKEMDGIVGAVMKQHPNDIILVISDHGFAPFRRGVNINTWLIKAGYMGLEDDASEEWQLLFGRRGAGGNGQPVFPGTTELENLLTRTEHSYSPTRWNQTQAYALGLGGIYLNLRGREPLGTVVPLEQKNVIDQIRSDLLRLNDFGDLRKQIHALVDTLQPNKDSERLFPESVYNLHQQIDLRMDQIELNLLPSDRYAQLDNRILDAFDGTNPFAQADSFVAVRKELDALLNTLFSRELKEKGEEAHADRRVVSHVYERDTLYRDQKHRLESPDLRVSFNRGWRISWQTALGGSPVRLLDDNRQKWSADHCTSDPAAVPGMLLCNRRLLPHPQRAGLPVRFSIQDIAPAVLHYYGVPPSATMDGKAFEFEECQTAP